MPEPRSRRAVGPMRSCRCALLSWFRELLFELFVVHVAEVERLPELLACLDVHVHRLGRMVWTGHRDRVCSWFEIDARRGRSFFVAQLSQVDRFSFVVDDFVELTPRNGR